MANYSVDAATLFPYLPNHTEIDLWNDNCYVSLVGFMFMNTKVKNMRIPFHEHFEEVNLRFYVKHKSDGAWKRGVVFIKEFVPKPALTIVANTVYRENYETLRMAHSWSFAEDKQIVEYRWKKGNWNSLKVITDRNSQPIIQNSEEEFITEHYWGYTKLSDKHTSEYGVEHPKWEVYKTLDYSIDVDFAAVYGKRFAFLSGQKPASVFLAEGSEICVKNGIRI